MHYETKRGVEPRRALLTLMTGVILFGLVLLPQSKASEMDKKTILTFSGHVQFPGVILGAGTYVVKRVDWGQPDILIIMNSEENHSYAMVHAIPIQRMRPTDKVEVTFYETRGLAAPAVKALFYPGDTIGEQFLYRRGGEVLGLAGGPVETSSSTASTATTNTANEPVASATSEPQAEAQPAESENTEIAQATPPPTPSSTQTQPTPAPEDRKELPKTASDLPLLALLGGLALALGSGLMSLAARRA